MSSIKNLLGATALGLATTLGAVQVAHADSYSVHQIDRVAQGSPSLAVAPAAAKPPTVMAVKSVTPTTDDESSYSVSQFDQVAKASTELRTSRSTQRDSRQAAASSYGSGVEASGQAQTTR